MQNLIALFTATETVDIFQTSVDLALAAVLSGLIYVTFIAFSSTISNRRQFGRIFFLVTVCTALIIVIIKSSIALSLGLVGALSVIRFRAAIKEPEELAYLFLCVATGLGFGAGMRVITISAVLLILAILALRGLVFHKKPNNAYNFSIIGAFTVSEATELLRPYTRELFLKRFDDEAGKISAMFAAEFKSLAKMEQAVEALKAKDANAAVSFLSNETLL